METHVIIGNDRCCHDNKILFEGTYQECKEKVNPWFKHPDYGGIDARILSKEDYLRYFSKNSCCRY